MDDEVPPLWNSHGKGAKKDSKEQTIETTWWSAAAQHLGGGNRRNWSQAHSWLPRNFKSSLGCCISFLILWRNRADGMKTDRQTDRSMIYWMGMYSRG